MSTARAPSRQERLVQMLTDLDAFCTDSTVDELQTLANEAKTVVTKMQNVLKRSKVEQVAKLVQAKEWARAMQQMKIDFSLATCIGNIEEVLELVYVGDNLDNLTNAIEWAGQLDALLRQRAYVTLYEQMKFKNHTDQPQVLMLHRNVKMLPMTSANLKRVKAQLDEDFQRFTKKIAEGVLKNDYSLIIKIDEIDDGFIFNQILPEVVRKFETFRLENVVLLVQCSMKLESIENSCYLIDTLMKALESNSCQETLGLHLWAHAKYTKEEETNWKNVAVDAQKLCSNVLNKLNKYKLRFFHLYQRYVEDKDEQKIIHLHAKNWHLQSILSEFVTWYYNQDNSAIRAKKLILTSRKICDFQTPTPSLILNQLHAELVQFKQANSFEAFCLFNEVKQTMLRDNFATLKPIYKAPFEELKAKAPACLHLLLWPEKNKIRFRLINKFYDTPLCIHEEQVFCCTCHQEKDFEQLCSVFVDPDTALVTFSFKSGDTCWKLDGTDLDGMAKAAWNGTQWKLKATDEHHVKIFTDDGKTNI